MSKKKTEENQVAYRERLAADKVKNPTFKAAGINAPPAAATPAATPQPVATPEPVPEPVVAKVLAAPPQYQPE